MKLSIGLNNDQYRYVSTPIEPCTGDSSLAPVSRATGLNGMKNLKRQTKNLHWGLRAPRMTCGHSASASKDATWVGPRKNQEEKGTLFSCLKVGQKASSHKCAALTAVTAHAVKQ